MDRKTIEITKKFAKRIKKGYKIDVLILFGSRARGDNFITSDFDFVIVSKDFQSISFLDRIPQVLKYWPYHYDLEPLCYTPEEFEKKAHEVGIVKIAVKEGKRII